MKLKELRKLKSLTQEKLAKDIGVARSTIAMYESGASEPDIEILGKLSNYFNVTIDYLLGNAKKTGVKIPVLGVIPAGIPIEAVEDILDYEEISQEMASKGEYFALKVKGDSMLPNIQDGDILIVRQQETAENGDTCVVMVNGYDATVKKIKKMETGIMLIPNNADYETMFFTTQEIIEKPVHIIGKAVEIRRSL